MNYKDKQARAKIQNITTDLADKQTQINNIATKFTDRIFKPRFCVSSYWGQNNDYYGATWKASRTFINNDIANWKHAGVDGVVIIIHISYNYTDKSFYVCENLTDMDYAIQQIQANGITVDAIKLHNNFTSTEIADAGDSAYQTAWLGFVNSIGARYQNSNIPIYTIMNEFGGIYNDTGHTTFVTNCINAAKSYGYKVGITVQGIADYLQLLPTVLNALDYLGLNFYPNITNKKDKATYEDSIKAWSVQYVVPLLKNTALNYPNLKFIISECGVQDYMIALSQTWQYSWNPADMVSSGGKAQAIFMLGMFENLNEEIVEQLWWWFGITNQTPTNNLIKHYVGGVASGIYG